MLTLRYLALAVLFCVAVLRPASGLAVEGVVSEPIVSSPIFEPISNPVSEPSYLIWGWDTRNQALVDVFGTAGAEQRSTAAWYLSPTTGQLTRAEAYQPIFELSGRVGLTLLPQRTNLWTYSDPSGVSQLSSYQNISIAPRAWSIGTLSQAVWMDNGSGTATALRMCNAQNIGVYAVSVYVEMEDGGVPVPASGGGCSTTGDFCLWIAGSPAPNPATVELVGGNVYRVSATLYLSSTGISLFGIEKTSGQSSRRFWVSGFQVEFTKGSYVNKSVPSNYIPTNGTSVTVNASKTIWPISSLIVPLPAGDEEMTLAAHMVPKFDYEEMPDGRDNIVKLLDFSGDEIGIIRPMFFMENFYPVTRIILADEDQNEAVADMPNPSKNQKIGLFAQIINSQKRVGYILPGQSSITWGEWAVHSYISVGPSIRVCPDPPIPFSLFWIAVYNKKLDDAQLLKNWN